MAKVNATESIEELYEQMKSAIQQSFARLYSAIKAREVRTLRQLQAVRKLCESSHKHFPACVKSVHISYDNGNSILEQVSHYGEVRLENVDLNSDTFVVEDYISPEEDHMYSYKDLENVCDHIDNLQYIQEAALREVTKAKDCVCSVHLTDVDVINCFRKEVPTSIISHSPEKIVKSSIEEKTEIEKDKKAVINIINDENLNNNTKESTNEKCSSMDERSKTDPTEEWLNCIKNQIETEPIQATDVMEHSKIQSKKMSV